MTRAQGIRHIPAYAHEHDLVWKMGPLEADRHLSSPSLMTLKHEGRAYRKWPQMRIATEPYSLLFQTVAETLQTIARDPRHLGAESGFLGVLHTWGQTLHHHPHIHCLVPAGGLALDGTAWVLSRLFRCTFLTALRQAAVQERLRMQGQCHRWRVPAAWRQFLTT